MKASVEITMLKGLLTVFALASGAATTADAANKLGVPQYQTLPPLREQARLYDGWRAERRAAIPSLLQKHGVDAWLMSQREYAEETVFWSLKPFTKFSARRRTTTIFFAANVTSDLPQRTRTWVDNTPAVWDELRDVLEQHDPATINLDIDSQISFSSGLHAGELKEATRQLGSRWSDRFVANPLVAVEYIATMPKAQLQWYRRLMETAWAMISEAFSSRVIVPGVTTCSDVEWWLRDKIQAMNYTTWFQPSVTILPQDPFVNLSTSAVERAIAYGDLLHVDFGVSALGLNTDTQHLAYILPLGHTEADIPASLIDGLATANKLQDIVVSQLRPGLSGNEVFNNTIHEMRKAGIEGRVYCHPIGDWGHAAGPVIGMANLQHGVPVLGDLPVLKNMYFSIEHYADHYVPELKKTVSFPTEEDVYWNEEKGAFDWVYGRQEKYHLVRSSGYNGLMVQS